MPTRHLAAALLASLLLGACAQPGADGATAEDTVDAPSGGTVTYAIDAEPTVLNPLTIDGNATATGNVVVPVLWSLWHVTPEGEQVPALLAGEPEVTEDPFAVTYTLRDDAVWSDGTPVSAEDVAFTVAVKQDPDIAIAVTEGYDRISDVTIVDERTVTLAFDGPFPAWRSLFSGPDAPVLPAHALDIETFDGAWSDGITGADGRPIASGPFVVESWERGQNLVLARNEAFWGEPAHLDRIVVRFVEDSGTQLQLLRGGEVDVLYPSPQAGLAEALAGTGAEIAVVDGPSWEHLTFNLAVAPLDRLPVRRAIAHAIDRDAIAAVALEGVVDAPQRLDAVFATADEPGDGPFDRYGHDPAEALRQLEAAGCDVSGVAGGGPTTCDGEPLVLRYTTTSGDERRRLGLELVQAQLADVGIGIEADLAEPGIVFSPDRLFGGPDGAWDLIVFAWSTGLDPVEAGPAWMCEGGTNFSSACDEELDALLLEADRTTDPAERAALVAAAEERVASELPVLPLYRSPQPTVWRAGIGGVGPHPLAIIGPLWNAEEWTAVAE